MNTDYVETVDSSEDLQETDSELNLYPDSVNIYYPSSSEAEEIIEDTETEEEIETEPEFLSDLSRDPAIRILDIAPAELNAERAVNYSDIKNLWTLNVNGVDYKVLFPTGAELDVIDGVLINRGSANITGSIIDDSFSDNVYLKRTITISALSSSNTQNQVYRYGSRSYITEYSTPLQGNNLVTNVSYHTAYVVDRPAGWSFSKEGIAIIAILLMLLIVNFIGGLIRR